MDILHLNGFESYSLWTCYLHPCSSVLISYTSVLWFLAHRSWICFYWIYACVFHPLFFFKNNNNNKLISLGRTSSTVLNRRGERGFLACSQPRGETVQSFTTECGVSCILALVFCRSALSRHMLFFSSLLVKCVDGILNSFLLISSFGNKLCWYCAVCIRLPSAVS